jgi:alpha-L-arabinofuranosidase
MNIRNNKTGIGLVASMTDTSNEDLPAVVKPFGIQMTRYPGGKLSNDFNWVQGKNVNNPKYLFPANKLKPWMDSCSIQEVMLVVSVFQDVETAVANLRIADKSGVPVTHITLGNEIYGDTCTFKGETMNWSGWKYYKRAKRLIKRIRDYFPDAKIYACAIGKRGEGLRQKTWNTFVKMLDSLVDGYDYHIYVPEGWTVDQRMEKFYNVKINSDNEILIGEYGTHNGQLQLMLLKSRVEEIADIALNYCLINYKPEKWGKIDHKDLSLTPEGVEFLNKV